MGCVEYGTCDICGEEKVINRKYYYYGVKDKGTNQPHFEMISYCSKCKNMVKPPKKITLEIDPIKESR